MVASDGKEKQLLRDGCAGEQGTTCGSSFTLLVNGAAAGSPSVPATDSAVPFECPSPFAWEEAGSPAATQLWLGRLLARGAGEQPGTEVHRCTVGQHETGAHP